MKKITYILLSIIALLFIYWCIPKSCAPTGKYERMDPKSELSKLRDSIKTSHNLILQAKSDSIVKVYNDSIAKIEKEKTKLKANYYALRKALKQYQLIQVDSNNNSNMPDHLPEWVKAESFNALINSGNMCDSLIMFTDLELNIKDSIISTRELQLKAVNELNKTHEITVEDMKALIAELKKELKKARKANDVLKVVAILATLANLVH